MLTNNTLEIIIVLLGALIVILPRVIKYLARPKNTPRDDMHDVSLTDKPFYYE